ncbi:MAG: hypothetical protein K0Q90_2075 [Paenibacillaceae bacterium]|nr:hypothetical protein [Paenibacillaceae bacterium]
MSPNHLIQMPMLQNEPRETLLDSTVSLESAIAGLWHCRTLFSPMLQHAAHHGSHFRPDAWSELLRSWVIFTRSLLRLREETVSHFVHPHDFYTGPDTARFRQTGQALVKQE